MKKLNKAKIKLNYLAVKNSFLGLWNRRLSFFMGRFANLAFFLLLLFVWRILIGQSNLFIDYREAEVMTYLAGLYLLRSFLFGAKSWQLALDITEGKLSQSQMEQTGVFGNYFFPELGQRLLNLFSASVELLILSLVFQIEFIPLPGIGILSSCLLSAVLALFLFYILSNVINMLAFWFKNIRWLRFSFKRILEVMSGAFFPLDILSKHLFYLSAHFPFFYLFYFPISIYLGKMQGTYLLGGLVWQVIWIAAVFALGSFVWESGVKSYKKIITSQK